MTMTSTKDLLNKLKKPFKSGKNSGDAANVEPPTSELIADSTVSEPSFPLQDKKATKHSDKTVITHTSKGDLQTTPPKIHTEPLPRDLHGDYTNHKHPTDETVVNQPPGLDKNDNPLYNDGAELNDGVGNFYDPKDTTTKGSKEQATRAQMLTDKQRKLKEAREARARGDLPAALTLADEDNDLELVPTPDNMKKSNTFEDAATPSLDSSVGNGNKKLVDPQSKSSDQVRDEITSKETPSAAALEDGTINGGVHDSKLDNSLPTTNKENIPDINVTTQAVNDLKLNDGERVLNPNLKDIRNENISTTAVYNEPIATPKLGDTSDTTAAANDNNTADIVDKKTTTESYTTGGAFSGITGVIAATAATAADYIGLKGSGSNEVPKEEHTSKSASTVTDPKAE